MTQPPYQHPASQPTEPAPAYPPPVDPFATAPISSEAAFAPMEPMPPAGSPPVAAQSNPGVPAGSGPVPFGQPPHAQRGMPTHPDSGAAPGSGVAYGQHGWHSTMVEPKKSKKGLVITAVVLGALLLCAVGGVAGFLILRDDEGQGAATAVEATDAFLSAVYVDGDAGAAENLVCSNARDREAIDAKINEVRQATSSLKSPKFSWGDPEMTEGSDNTATAQVVIKLVTADEKVSQQPLKLLLVQREKTGWFVCEVQQG